MAPASALQPAPSTLDLLKLAAVVAMIVDHIGLYFLPEQPMLRAIGRPAAVIFGFLIGYAASTRVPPSWVGLGLGLTLLERALSDPPGDEDEDKGEGEENDDGLVALDILIALALTRIVMPFFAWLHGVRAWLLIPAGILLALAAPVTNHYFEYGTEIAVVALLGLARRLELGGASNGLTVAGCALVAFATVASVAVGHFGFNEAQSAVAIVLLAVTIVALMVFVKAPVAGVPAFLAAPLAFVGRTTLWIYAVHLALFQVIAHVI